ncbi:MAG: hypothetical protein L6Q94_07680 [Calditrichia bacterium]|nr:hypothetical protein [Calditrichia bacterium]
MNSSDGWAILIFPRLVLIAIPQMFAMLINLSLAGCNYSGILPQRAQRAQRYKKLAKKTCLVEKDVPQAGKTILNALHEVVDTQNSSSVASVISVAE